MKTLYNYQQYEQPRYGIFSVMKEPNEYKPPEGWLHEEREYRIIGECDDLYVTRLQETEGNVWGVEVQERFILPVGLHKTRLLRWTSGQLSLFDEYHYSQICTQFQRPNVELTAQRSSDWLDGRQHTTERK